MLAESELRNSQSSAARVTATHNHIGANEKILFERIFKSDPDCHRYQYHMNSERMKHLSQLLAVLFITSCVTSAADIRVLFIGNSYTAPLKSTLPALLKQSPNSAAETQFITHGGFTLQKHLISEATRDEKRSYEENTFVKLSLETLKAFSK